MSQKTTYVFRLKTGFKAEKTKNILRGRSPGPPISALPVVLCKFALIAYVLLAVCQLLLILGRCKIKLDYTFLGSLMQLHLESHVERESARMCCLTLSKSLVTVDAAVLFLSVGDHLCIT